MSTSFVQLSGAAFVAAVLVSTGAEAQNCDKIIEDSVLTQIKNKKTNSKTAEFHWACNHSFQEHSTAFGGGASASYAGMGGSGSYSESNYDKWKQESCSQSSRSNDTAELLYEFKETADKNMLDQYEKCINASVIFHCEPDASAGTVTVKLNANKADIKDTYKVVLGKSVRDIVSAKQLGRGTQNLVISDPRTAPIYFIMNVDIAGIGLDTCKVYFPAQHQLEYLVGTWYDVGCENRPTTVYYDKDGLRFRNHDGLDSEPIVVATGGVIQVTWRHPTDAKKLFNFNASIKQDTNLGMYIDFPGGGQWWRAWHNKPSHSNCS